MAVMAAVWGSSQHLRRLALEHLLTTPRCRRTTWKTDCPQSFHLLHMHLRTLMVEHPEPADTPAAIHHRFEALQHKLPYLRSLSAMDAQGRIVVSTHAAMLGSSWRWGGCCHRWRRRRQGCCALAPGGARFCRWCALAAAAPGAVGGGCGIFPSPWCCQRHRSGRWWPPSTAITSSTSHQPPGVV